MAMSIDYGLTANENRIVQQLRECGASSFEDLTHLPGLDWATVFSIIDRLNRAGFVVLERHGADYRVSLEKET